ncbi:MAG: endonuclease/exonuclease/phosphatase family protein [Deltaproteobacteria bacterium]|nr:endonuclease/exonuclease/phosphatase family protein [Deltaproteobacteria bacterium]
MFALVDGMWVPADDPAASAPAAPLRIATWNVWFGEHRFRRRGRALLDELRRRAPDVIALQEVTAPLLDALLDEPWVRARYRISDVEMVQAYDVALLSRVPVRRTISRDLPSDMGRRLLAAELACGLVVGCVHLESMREYARARSAQLRIVQAELRALGRDTVLVGDMNFAPEDELETAAIDPEVTDVWAALHPGEPGWSVDGVRNVMRAWVKGNPAQKRIDRVFLRGARTATSIELLGTSPLDADTFVSDHFGLEVALAPP